MTETLLDRRPPTMDAPAATPRVPDPRGARTLRVAARTWWTAMFVGQAAFLAYIVGFYGTSIARGDLSAWNRNRMLPTGYVAGDTMGNLMFAAHVMLAALIAAAGVLQLVPRLRARAIAFHRWNGRLFLIAAMAASVAGLYLVWFRPRRGLLGAIAISLDAVLILLFAALAWRAARAKDTARHRRWALRAFLVTNAVWFQRVGFTAWMVVQQGPVAMTEFFRVWQFLSYLLPLGVLELYLHVQSRGTGRERLGVAALLLLVTTLMSAGLVAFFVGFQLPLLG